MMDLLLLLLAVAGFLFWLIEFLHLMSLPDAAFPGRYDKVLWFVALILTSVVGALAFMIWKIRMMRQSSWVARLLEPLRREAHRQRRAT